MIGVIILTAFFSLMAVKLFARRRMCAAGLHGWHHHRWGGHGPWRGFGPGSRGGRGSWMWAALARLDLSPAQEKVVRAELDMLKRRGRTLRDEGGQSRADLARAVRGEEFEEGALASMFIRHDERMHDLRGDLAGAIGRIHAVLDPEQRARLADILERGPSRSWGGPYRGFSPTDTADI